MPTRSPIAGVCYPRDYGEFMAWFPTDDDCADYLEWLRWPFGFACPGCQSVSACRLADGRYKCTGCRKCTSVTAGTIFDRTRTPLTVWFHAAWHFATQKDGISALALQRDLALSSYQTVWAMLHRLRSVAVRPGRERLSGDVEVDETFIGGKAPGDKGGRTHGEKALVAIAVERREPKGWWRCRMAVIPDASSASLGAFLQDNVEAFSTVVADGWGPYEKACDDLYVHEPHVAPGRKASEVLPAVHEVAGLVKKWLNSTHQGAIGDEHLHLYLNEYVFRFNRRRSGSRGLLFYRLFELAVAARPARYRQFIVAKRPKATKPAPPATRGVPLSLERSHADRPCRRAA